jgi:hypothetical protein
VSLAEHDEMVETLASERTDQPFQCRLCQGDRGAVGRSRMPMREAVDTLDPLQAALDRHHQAKKLSAGSAANGANRESKRNRVTQ